MLVCRKGANNCTLRAPAGLASREEVDARGAALTEGADEEQGHRDKLSQRACRGQRVAWTSACLGGQRQRCGEPRLSR